jgi:hypothetical protein
MVEGSYAWLETTSTAPAKVENETAAVYGNCSFILAARTSVDQRKCQILLSWVLLVRQQCSFSYAIDEKHRYRNVLGN